MESGSYYIRQDSEMKFLNIEFPDISVQEVLGQVAVAWT